jgi:hypothetical protein
MENGIIQTISATTCTAAVNPLSSSSLSLPLPLSPPSSITAPSRSEQHNSNSNLNSNLNSQNGESSQKNDSEREIVAKQDQNHADCNTKTDINNTDSNIKDDKNNSSKGPPNPHGSRHQNNSNNNNNKRRRGRKQPTSVKVITPVEGCSVCKIVQEDNGPPKYKCPKCRASYCSVVCCRQHKTVCPGKDGGQTTAATTTATMPGATTVAASNSNYTIVNNNTIKHGDDNDDSDSEEEEDDDDDSLEEGFKITEDMKNALRKSTWLRNELQDGGLRDMISSVVRSGKKFKKSQNNNNNKIKKNKKKLKKKKQKQQQQQQHCPHPHDELAAKRQDNQNFDVFVDKLLVLGDVLERRQGDIIIRDVGSPGGGGFINGTDIPPRRNEEELEEWLKRKWVHGDLPQDLTLKPRPRKLKVIPKFEPVDVSSSEEEDEDMNESQDLKDDDDDDDDDIDNKSNNDDGDDEEKSSSRCDDS